MLNSVVHGLISQTLSQYIEDLDLDTINVGLWDGEIQLHHLQVTIVIFNILLN